MIDCEQNVSQLLAMCLQALERLGVEVRFDDLRIDDELKASGGLYRRQDQVFALIDKRADPIDQLNTLMDIVKQLDWQDIYLPPSLRDLLE